MKKTTRLKPFVASLIFLMTCQRSAGYGKPAFLRINLLEEVEDSAAKALSAKNVKSPQTCKGRRRKAPI